MREIIGLARIQHIDSQIDQLVSRLDYIKIKLTDDKELKRINKSLIELRNKFQTSKLKLDNSEKTLLENSKKISQSESNLYSGNIKNPKELQEVENEISSLKRLKSSHEEILFQIMMEVEEISNEIDMVSSNYQTAEDKFNKCTQDMIAEKDTIQKEIDVLFAERKAVEGSISDDSINLYEKLRVSKKGVAVSTVADGVCSSCGSTLTPTQIQTVKSSNLLIPCSTCGRLLFSQ